MMPDIRHNVVSNSFDALPGHLEEAMWQLKIEDGKGEADSQLNSYPDRPGEPDCLYYLRTGVCGYGSKCKYNHPTHTGQNTQVGGELPQRDGEPDCQFFLKTGSCKYGATCKYHHPRDKQDAQLVQLNFLGLPVRKDEKSCAYYMKTGSCNYGVACKFNHPQPPTLGATYPVMGSSGYGYSGSMAPTLGSPVVGGVSPWPSLRVPYISSPCMQGVPPFVPLVLPPTQGNMRVQQRWSTYMGSMNQISSTDMLASNQIANSKHQAQPGTSIPPSLPRRPDQPECQYYLKTGSCKYGDSCKYHHPKERNHAAMATIGPLGLPLRPGQPVCTFYATYGSCKDGTACKFDHPPVGYYSYALPSYSYPDPSAAFSNQRSIQVIWTSAENSYSKSSKSPDQLTKSETSIAQQGDHNKEHGDPSAHSSRSSTEPHSESAK